MGLFDEIKATEPKLKKKIDTCLGVGMTKILVQKSLREKVIFFAIKRQLIYYLNDKIITRLSLLNVKTKCFNFRQDDSQVF